MMTPATNPKTVRYLHFAPSNTTFKFLLEDGQWVCRTTEEFLTDAEDRLERLKDDLK
jgi:hypothetical protein